MAHARDSLCGTVDSVGVLHLDLYGILLWCLVLFNVLLGNYLRILVLYRSLSLPARLFCVIVCTSYILRDLTTVNNFFFSWSSLSHTPVYQCFCILLPMIYDRNQRTCIHTINVHLINLLFIPSSCCRRQPLLLYSTCSSRYSFTASLYSSV